MELKIILIILVEFLTTKLFVSQTLNFWSIPLVKNMPSKIFNK